MYEILLTRIFSVTMLYHFAFVALSLAMFGMTVGALIVYLAPRLVSRDRLHHRLAVAGVAFPIAMVLSFLTQLSIPFPLDALDRGDLPHRADVCRDLGAVRRQRHCGVSRAHRLSARGQPALRRRPGGRRARLPAADCRHRLVRRPDRGALGRRACEHRRRRLRAARPGRCGASTAMWLVVCCSPRRLPAYGPGVAGYADIAHPLHEGVRRTNEPLPLYDKWNSYSRVRVRGDPNGNRRRSAGASARRCRRGSALNQLLIDIDVAAGTGMTRFDGDFDTVAHLKYDVTNIGYYLVNGSTPS